MHNIVSDEVQNAPEVLRFRRSERMVHWAIAVPFMTCYATALILVFFYNPHPMRHYRDIFSLSHRISGMFLVMLPMLAIIKSRHDYRVFFRNIKHAWIWTAEDIKWLALMGLAAISSRFRLPEQGKFNAAEKLNFMVLMSTYPLYILTGAFIWFTKGALLSWLIHFGMAFIATPFLLGHLFMATVNPGTRAGLSGMITGFVDRHWAKHHYAGWFRENFENGSPLADTGITEAATVVEHSHFEVEPSVYKSNEGWEEFEHDNEDMVLSK